MASTTSSIDATDPDRSVPLVDVIRDAITEGEFAANQRLILCETSPKDCK